MSNDPTQADPPWSWPEERWRSVVGAVRAGRSLRPKKWKGGARCAVALSFDAGHETGALSRGGSAHGLALGQYGARQGAPRILRLLKRHNVAATFFIPAVTALLHPQETKAIADAGHEVALQTWIGESRAGLAYETERDLTLGARDILEKASGMKPVGLRAAGDFSAQTLRIIREMGLLYDASLGADDDPYELLEAGAPTGVVELPASPTLDDRAYFAAGYGAPQGGRSTPEATFDIFRRELEVAYEEGGLFALTLHPHIIGRRSRIWILDEILKVARTLPGVWFTTHADIAAFCKAKG